MLIGNLNIPLSTQVDIQIESKGIFELDNTLVQMNVTNVYRTFHPIIAEYTLFSSAYRIFSRIDYMLYVKQVLTNFRRLKPYQATFPNTMDNTRNQQQSDM